MTAQKLCFPYKCTLKNGTLLEVGQKCGEFQECQYLEDGGRDPFGATCQCNRGYVEAKDENRCYCPDYKIHEPFHMYESKRCRCPRGTVIPYN
jgi:hypothetical protein